MRLDLNHVTKKYKDFQLDCTMQLEEGRVTGLIGRNGAGKSTTFKAILGLIHQDGGSITVDGVPLQQMGAKWKENLGVVLADSGFSGYLKIKDLISIMQNTYPDFDKQAFMDKCKHFQLPMDKKIKDFSTGMKVKLKVLVAMSHRAKLLILDEPTAGLDVVAREEILDMLRDFMEEAEDRSILISSHISRDLEGLCDDVYFIDKGIILLHEEMDALLDSYGILKVTKEQLQMLEQEYLLCKKRESYGYCCLTNQKQFYLENYPEITVEKGNVDEVITVLLGSDKEA